MKFHTNIARRLFKDCRFKSREQSILDTGILSVEEIAVMYDVYTITVKHWRKADDLKDYP